MMARTGQLRQKVTEEQLKSLLGSLSEMERKEKGEGEGGGLGGMKVVRRKGNLDDDDLDDLLNDV